MKNKTKKILAAACLGVVGMGALSGCSITDEQKAALDLVAEKSDKIISLLEENAELANKKLSKEEAAEKIAIARNFWMAKEFNALLRFDTKGYQGLYEKSDGVVTSVSLYMQKREGFFNSAAFVSGYMDDGETLIGEQEGYMKSDYENDIYYSYKGDEFRSREYHEADGFHGFVNDGTGDIIGAFGVRETITPDMIKELKVLEDGYRFTIYHYECGYDNRNNETTANRFKIILTLKNDKITDFEVECVEFTTTGAGGLELNEDDDFVDEPEVVFNTVSYGVGGEDDDVSVITYVGSYQYENIDFSAINQKFSEIEAEYLTNA